MGHSALQKNLITDTPSQPFSKNGCFSRWSSSSWQKSSSIFSLGTRLSENTYPWGSNSYSKCPASSWPFLGGIVLGLTSPGIRIYKPAAGAFLSVTTMMFVSWFTAHPQYGYSFDKVLLVGPSLSFSHRQELRLERGYPKIKIPDLLHDMTA